jgi:hypothetical protein
MLSHDLAKHLLLLPNLQIATYANNHTYMSGNDRDTHGSLNIGLLETYNLQHIIIGNFYRKNINLPNWYISEVFVGTVYE